MVLDILWNNLLNIINNIQSFINNLFQSFSNIANTGQGLFLGLSVLGSTIWDSINNIGNQINNAFTRIKEGINEGIRLAFESIANAFNFIASNIYSFGHWLYNGLKTLWNALINIIQGLYQTILNLMSNIINGLNTFINTQIDLINNWFTQLIIRFRSKLVQSIGFSLATVGLYSSFKRLIKSKSLNDITWNTLGLIISPLTAYTIANFVDQLLPIPQTDTYPLIPNVTPLQITIPSIIINQPSEPFPPDKGQPVQQLNYIIELTLLPISSESYTSTNEFNLLLFNITSDYFVNFAEGELTLFNIQAEYSLVFGNELILPTNDINIDITSEDITQQLLLTTNSINVSL